MESKNQEQQDKPVQNKKILYPECNKGGNHTGELANFICLDPGCKENNIICCICFEESHKTHQVKPVKYVIEELDKKIQNQPKVHLNQDEINNFVESSKININQLIGQVNIQLNEKFLSVQSNYSQYCDTLKMQIECKSSNKQDFAQAYKDLSDTKLELKQFSENLNKLIDVFPIGVEESTEVQTDDVMKDITTKYECLKEKINKKSSEFQKQVEQELQEFVVAMNPKDLFNTKSTFVFSEKLKHSNITLTGQMIAKSSTGTQSYKFCLLEPNINLKNLSKPLTFAFKININNVNYGNNWIAVGVCHKNIIVQKNYNFTFSTLGHGAYMVSSNGGTWSNTNAQQNNSVKAFKFGSGDIIACKLSHVNKTIEFKNVKTNQTYQLNLQYSLEDQLHPCVLFYYLNDEVEFINNYSY